MSDAFQDRRTEPALGHTCDQMYCTHVPRPARSPVWVSTDACPGAASTPADAASGNPVEITVQFADLACWASCLMLELDLELCTPRDVVCHLVREGSLRRESPNGGSLQFAIVLGGAFLPRDVPLARSGVAAGAVLVLHRRMVA